MRMRVVCSPPRPSTDTSSCRALGAGRRSGRAGGPRTTGSLLARRSGRSAARPPGGLSVPDSGAFCRRGRSPEGRRDRVGQVRRGHPPCAHPGNRKSRDVLGTDLETRPWTGLPNDVFGPTMPPVWPPLDDPHDRHTGRDACSAAEPPPEIDTIARGLQQSRTSRPKAETGRVEPISRSSQGVVQIACPGTIARRNVPLQSV